jgi:hypothetical protein
VRNLCAGKETNRGKASLNLLLAVWKTVQSIMKEQACLGDQSSQPVLKAQDTKKKPGKNWS